MARELPRTLFSLQSPYQKKVNTQDIEIIVVDNGSTQPVNIPVGFSNVTLIRHPNPNKSPASAINLGFKVARADFIGVLPDGARMASPGLCHFALKARAMYDRCVVSSLGFHLGPDVQMKSVEQGYCQSVEDALLSTIPWQSNGYKLFIISSLAGSCAKGFFNPIAESNAIFMERSMWQELGFYDERFRTPGGGLVNLDTYVRACDLPDSELIVLLNEGTFHQVHGGIATNQKREDASWKVFHDEYVILRGKNFEMPSKEPTFLGKYHSEAKGFLKYSVQKAPAKPSGNEFLKLNHIVAQNTYCKPFQENIHAVVDSKLIDAPVVMTGRGGSGTRLLSQLMQNANIFIGNEVNATEDSIEWVRPIYDLVINDIRLENNRFSEMHIDRLRLNATNILRLRKDKIDRMWGWKLPETMLCVPEVFKAFPKARLIHLVRHPVSLSLRRTHMTSRFNNQVGKSVLTKAYAEHGLDLSQVEKNPEYLNNALSWEYQVSRVLDFAESHLSDEQYLLVHYEDIYTNPQRVLNKINEFLGLPPAIAAKLEIDMQRVQTYPLPDSRVDEVWSICGKTAARLGYIKDSLVLA